MKRERLGIAIDAAASRTGIPRHRIMFSRDHADARARGIAIMVARDFGVPAARIAERLGLTDRAVYYSRERVRRQMQKDMDLLGMVARVRADTSREIRQNERL